MQHFASFIRLSDKNLDAARGLLNQAKKGEVNNWSQLSGFNPKKTSGVLRTHDSLQHRLIDKPLFKATTGVDPNTLFRDGSLQQKTSQMPLVQNRQVPKNSREMANETLEKLVDVASYPESVSRMPHDTSKLIPNTKFDAVLPYIKKKFTQPERLAGMKFGQHLDYMDNRNFRSQYMSDMRDNKMRRSMAEKRVDKLNSESLPPDASKADSLRAKLSDRQNYTNALNQNDNLSNREVKLNQYRQTGLMPR